MATKKPKAVFPFVKVLLLGTGPIRKNILKYHNNRMRGFLDGKSRLFGGVFKK